MNILLFTLEYPPFKGGVANYYENVVRHWPEEDSVFVLNNNDNKLLTDKIRPRWLPAFYHLYKAVKKENIDHILVGNILPLGTVSLVVAKLLGIKFSVFLHGMDFEYSLKRKRKKILSYLILKNADKIICVNSYVASLVEKFLPVKNKIVISNPGINPYNDCDYILTKQIRDKYNLNGKVIFLSIGRMVKRKGFDMAIKAVKELSDKNIAYFISGNGPDREEIKSLADGVENIFFLDNLNDPEKWAWLGACDCFIMPSRNISGDVEGFGIVYLEANLMGKPVIAGASGGVGDAVIDGVNGLMVDPENITDIKRAITEMASDKGLREKLGTQGEERALREFVWDNLIINLSNNLKVSPLETSS